MTKLVGGDLTRRNMLQLAGAGAATLAMPNIVRAQSREIKIGYITALSGPRASFGVSDEWMLGEVKKAVSDGLKIDGANYAVEFVLKDNQSNQNTSASVGNELILRENVDMLLIQDGDASVATGEMADVAGVPSMSTMMPWQAWMFPRGGAPDTGFPFTFTFFWGADDAMSTYVRIWDQLDTNKKVGDFYFDNQTGQAFAHPELGLPAFIDQGGYSRTDGGMFKLETDDFSSQISRFKEAGVDIVTGFGIPTHWATFWSQAGQQGFTPEAATFAGAFLFPSDIEALGDRGDGMTTEVWWTPKLQVTSSLTGQTGQEVADKWEADSGKQWLQTLGYSHALFEVGINALKQSGDPKNKEAVRDAMAATKIDSLVGPVNFAESPVKNVAITQLAGGQWRKSSGKYPFELVVTENAKAPAFEKEADTVALSKLG